MDRLISDCEALWAFYQALDDKGALDDDPDTAWGATNPIENWLGVTVSDHRVEEIRLNEAGLQGATAPELGFLTALKDLNLADNLLSGPIPAELSSLTKLLTGPIPAELGRLTNLRHLDLESNSLSGPIPLELGGLTNLEYLWLDSNDLSGPIPAELGDLPNLKILDLRNNPLQLPAPDNLVHPRAGLEVRLP